MKWVFLLIFLPQLVTAQVELQSISSDKDIGTINRNFIESLYNVNQLSDGDEPPEYKECIGNTMFCVDKYNNKITVENVTIYISTTDGSVQGICFPDGTCQTSAGVGSIAIVSNANQFTGDGTVANPLTLLSSSVTLQGNSFNSANKLVQLDGAGNISGGINLEGGYASLNILKSGDTMTGALLFNKTGEMIGVASGISGLVISTNVYIGIGANVSTITPTGFIGDGSGLTNLNETDPVVGAVSGLVKADGAGGISAAVAGTDYLTPTGDGSGLTNLTAANLVGTVPNASVDLSTVAGLGDNTFTGVQTYGSGSSITAAADIAGVTVSTAIFVSDANGANVSTITPTGFIGDGSQLTNVVHSTDALVNDVNELKLSTGSLDVRIYNLGISTQNLDYNKVPYEGVRTDIDMGTYSIVSIGRIGTGYKVQPLSDGSEVVYENSNPLYPLDVYGNVLIKDGGLLFSSSTITIDDTGIEYPNFSDISGDCLYDNTVGLVSDDGNYFKVYGENGCALYVKIGRAFGGLGVPTNSSITGIKAYLEGYTNNIDSTSITQARLKTYPGTYYGESKHNDFSLTSNNTLFIAGDDTDDWQGNLTPDIVNTGGTPTGFGWEIKLEFTGSATVYIDYMAIQGFYTNAGFFRIKKHSDEVNFSVNGSSYIIINDAGEYLLNIDGDLNITGDYYQNGSLFSGTGGGGDNLGNHIATTTLDMSNYDIANANHITASSVTATTFYGNISNTTGINADIQTSFDNVATDTTTIANNVSSNDTDIADLYANKVDLTETSSVTVNNAITANEYHIDGQRVLDADNFNYSVSLGHNAGFSGFGITNLGSFAGANNSGNFNTNIGEGAGAYFTTGTGNTILGSLAGIELSGASSNNVLVGHYAYGAGIGSSEANNNVVIGYKAGYSATTASNNIFIGYQSADSVTTGNNNIVIGYDKDLPNAATSYYLNIGGLITGELNNSSATIQGDLWANNFYGDLIGNADTASAFDHDPSACASGDFVTDISADGTLTCATPSGSGGVDETADYNWTGVHTFQSSTTFNNTISATEYDINGKLFIKKLSGLYSMSLGEDACNSGTATGNYNTCIGSLSGRFLTSGYQNALLGGYAGYNITTGVRNTIVGHAAGYLNNTNDNTAIGFAAGYKTSVTGVFIGSYAGYENTTGAANTIIGMQAGQYNSTGYNNTFLGFLAGRNNTTSHDNLFLGVYSGQVNTGNNNVAIGNFAGRYNEGDNGVFIGVNAGNNNKGDFNTFIGAYSGAETTTGDENLYLGNNVGRYNPGGRLNVGIGRNALGSNNTITHNTSTNVAIGYNSGAYLDSGYQNVFLGAFSGLYSTSTTNSIFIGYNAGRSNRRGNNNIIISNNDLGSTELNDYLNIGNVIRGNLLTGNIGIGTTAPSYKLDVSGDINASGSYRQGGTAGTTLSCSASQTIGGAVVNGGILTGGSCVAFGGGDAVLSATQTWTGENTYEGKTYFNEKIYYNNKETIPNILNSSGIYTATTDANISIAFSTGNYIIDFNLAQNTSNGALYMQFDSITSGYAWTAIANNASGAYAFYGANGTGTNVPLTYDQVLASNAVSGTCRLNIYNNGTNHPTIGDCVTFFAQSGAVWQSTRTSFSYSTTPSNIHIKTNGGTFTGLISVRKVQ